MADNRLLGQSAEGNQLFGNRSVGALHLDNSSVKDASLATLSDRHAGLTARPMDLGGAAPDPGIDAPLTEETDIDDALLKVKYDDAPTLVAKENPGYRFVGWYDGETLLSTEREYTTHYLGDVTLTDNCCVAGDGVHFVFNECEVADYAAGPIEVVVRKADKSR